MTRFATFLCVTGLACIVGCGPNDSGVTSSVEDRLESDTAVQADAIDVTTQDGVVTLSGEVGSQVEREQAVMIARQTDGVRDVVDRLRVADATPTTGFDIDAPAQTTPDPGATQDETQQQPSAPNP